MTRRQSSQGGPAPREPARHAACSGLLITLLCAAPLSRAQDPWPPAPALPPAPAEASHSLPESVKAEPRAAAVWRVTFRYRPEREVESVCLAGSFNSWNPASKPLEDQDRDGTWTAAITLGAGEYQYKFVLDGGRAWVHDPLNPQRAPDGHGGSNSVLYLGRLASLEASPARSGDGEIDATGMLHEPAQPKYLQPLGAGRGLFRYRTFAHDVTGVTLHFRGAGAVPMRRVHEDALFAYWEATAAPRAGDGADQVEYAFVLEDAGVSRSDPTTQRYSLKAAPLFETPAWTRHAVWCQIMPDRFRNGDASNDPDPVHPWTSDWFSRAPWESKSGQSFYKWYVFSRLYGGDLAGLEQQLPYLKELGVNALYLNPIFESESHHKYNASNYLHVDQRLGGGGDYDEIVATEDLTDPSTWKWTTADRRFLAFLKQAHEAGFRVILDGVWNHVGVRHPAFQDVKQNGQDSKYADWFEIKSWDPFEHVGWAGFDSLPVFRKSETGLASEGASKHIFDVTRRWMDPDGDGDPRDGIDGWRLDVPNEIAMPFWAQWRQHVKSINSDAYIVGEIWDRADAWLDGAHFDAVMNYEFARAVVAWIGHDKQRLATTQLDHRLALLRLAYPAAATYCMQNLVDSHDTDRLVSMIANPDRAYDHENRVQDDNPDYDNARPGPAAYQRARLVALVQMTYVGAPMIYYGDEAGMWGADDPTCRKPMLWEDLEPYEKPEENHVDREHLAFYRAAVKLRNEHAALRDGDFRTLLADDAQRVWAFARSNADQWLVVALNASDDPRAVSIPLPPDAPRDGWRVVFGARTERALSLEDSRVSLSIPAVSGIVLHAAAK